MKTGTLVTAEADQILADPAWFATGLCEPARGLLFRAPLRAGAALIIPTRGVHTLGMAYPLDLVAVDRHWTVLSVYEGWPPWRLGPQHRRARYFVEMPPGAVAQWPVAIGMRLRWRETSGVRAPWTLDQPRDESAEA